MVLVMPRGQLRMRGLKLRERVRGVVFWVCSFKGLISRLMARHVQ